MYSSKAGQRSHPVRPITVKQATRAVPTNARLEIPDTSIRPLGRFRTDSSDSQFWISFIIDDPEKLNPTMSATPARTVAEGDKDVDLGKVADKVNKAETPHRDKGHPPALSVVLFAKLDKDSAKKAEEAAGKIKGIDAKETKANAEKGEVSVRIKGSDKVTTDDLIKALKDVGIEAKLTKDDKTKDAKKS
jgi:hypothetical protein